MHSDKTYRELRHQVNSTPHNSPQRPLLLNSLALSLRKEFQHGQDKDILTDAINTMEECVFVSEGTFAFSKYLFNLASMYFLAEQNAVKSKNEGKLLEILVRSIEGKVAAPAQILANAAGWISIAFVKANWSDCLQAFKAYRDSLRKLLIVQSITSKRIPWLENTSIVFSMAAYAALRELESNPASEGETQELLLESLEYGRARIFSDLVLEQAWFVRELSRREPKIYSELAEYIDAIRKLESKLPIKENIETLRQLYSDVGEVLASGRSNYYSYTDWRILDISSAKSLVSKSRDIDAFLYLNRSPRGAMGVAVTNTELLTIFEKSQLLGDLPIAIHGENIRFKSRTTARIDEQSDLQALMLKEFGNVVSQISGILVKKGISRIAVSLGGGLAGIPVHCLELSESGNPHYFCELFQLCYAPSLRSYMAVEEQRLGRRDGIYLGIANPRPTGLELPGAEFEVRVAESYVNRQSVRLEHKEADRNTVLKHLPNSLIVHFACHGLYGSGPMSETRIQLGNHSHLELIDFMRGDAELKNTRLTILSACHSGRVQTNFAPDEAIGLPLGLFISGVPAVVATMWAIDDTCSMLFISQFMRRLNSKCDNCLVAFTMAQKWIQSATIYQIKKELVRLRKRTSWNEKNVSVDGPDEYCPFKSIKHWGAFVLVGS